MNKMVAADGQPVAIADPRAVVQQGPARSRYVIKYMRVLLRMDDFMTEAQAKRFSGHSGRHTLVTIARLLGYEHEDRRELGRWLAALGDESSVMLAEALTSLYEEGSSGEGNGQRASSWGSVLLVLSVAAASLRCLVIEASMRPALYQLPTRDPPPSSRPKTGSEGSRASPVRRVHGRGG